jgi:hypothetical protein
MGKLIRRTYLQDLFAGWDLKRRISLYDGIICRSLFAGNLFAGIHEKLDPDLSLFAGGHYMQEDLICRRLFKMLILTLGLKHLICRFSLYAGNLYAG